MRTFRRFFSERDDEHGQSIVEFALLLPVMLLIITGLFDVARAVWQENTLAYAAREGTRYLIVRGDTAPPGQQSNPLNPSDPVTLAAKDVVKQAAVGTAGVTVNVVWPGTPVNQCGTIKNKRGCQVQVDASAPFVPLPSQYLLGGAFQITLRGGSVLVIQR
jgi:Flp pilus assembly protein TadG